jgi:hypothetical protein
VSVDGKSGYRRNGIHLSEKRVHRPAAANVTDRAIGLFMDAGSQGSFQVGQTARPACARNDQPVVDCAYDYQKENQEEADEVEKNCGQEGGADEEGG